MIKIKYYDTKIKYYDKIFLNLTLSECFMDDEK